jgi:hypothetical protein
MHEVQMWVIVLFVIMSFDRIAILWGRVGRYWDARGNGKTMPVTVEKLRAELGIPLSGNLNFMQAAEETNKAHFQSLIGSVNALTQINGRLLDQIKELIMLERARIEIRQQGE